MYDSEREEQYIYRYRLPESPDTPDGINVLKNALEKADTVIIGAGAGLSTSAGYIYTVNVFRSTSPILLKSIN